MTLSILAIASISSAKPTVHVQPDYAIQVGKTVPGDQVCSSAAESAKFFTGYVGVVTKAQPCTAELRTATGGIHATCLLSMDDRVLRCWKTDKMFARELVASDGVMMAKGNIVDRAKAKLARMWAARAAAMKRQENIATCKSNAEREVNVSNVSVEVRSETLQSKKQACEAIQ